MVENNENKEYKFKYEYFIVNSGGGFTGQYDDYKFHSNGQVEMKGFSSNQYYTSKEISLVEVNKLFLELESLNAEYINFKKPGNISHNLIIPVSNGEHSITWSESNVNSNVENFHTKAMEIAKKLFANE